MSEDPARYDAGPPQSLDEPYDPARPLPDLTLVEWQAWAADLAFHWAVFSDSRGQLAYHLPRLVARLANLEAQIAILTAALPACIWCERQTGQRTPILPGHTCVRPRSFHEGETP